jgi:tetratricopeptide (TPR) repeat protein
MQICLVAGLLTVALTGCGGAKARYASHLQRGEAFLTRGNLDKARIEFGNALQIEPRGATALYLSGRVAEQRGNIREAVGLYQAAIEVKPDYDQARASLGKVFVFGGVPKRALEIIGPGLAKRPDEPDLLAARAAANHQLKNDADAFKDAEHAVRIAPTNQNAIAVLAAMCEQTGDHQRALSLVSDAVRQSPA